MAASLSQTEMTQHLHLHLHVAHYVPIISGLVPPEQQVYRSPYSLYILHVLPSVAI